MSDSPVRRLRAGDADRDRIAVALQRAHGAGRLTEQELTERRDQARRAVYLDELPDLLADLPEHEGWELLPAEERRFSALAVPAATPAPVARPDALPATVPEELGLTFTVMSGRDLTLDPGTTRLRNFAWWGGNNYDLTRALGPGRTVTLTLHAVMAGSDIRVPPGVRVIDNSTAIMAGNEIDAAAQGDGSNGTLVIDGFLWWAGNSVKLAPGA